MNVIELRAKAKINLTLDVIGRRKDGYHDVKMLMQTVELFDTVTVRRTKKVVSVVTNLKYLPDDGRNIAYKAADAFFQHTKILGGAEISINKRIPVAAGLAGGSSDAAAVLKGLNMLYSAGFTTEQLCKIGLALGADVPYCISGGTALAEGIGEVLTALRPLPYCYAVICKPQASISTARIFQKIDSAKLLVHPDTAGAMEAIANGDLRGLCRRLYNVMEEITAKDCSAVLEIKSSLLSMGALGAVMSGSGPSVYGLFDDKTAAQSAASALMSTYKHRAAFCVPISEAGL